MTQPSTHDETSRIDSSHLEEALAAGALAPLEDDGPQSISYPKPLFGYRVLAFAIDSLVGTAGYLPMFIWYAATDESTFSTRVLALRVFIALGWGVFYVFTKDGWAGGQSLGKKLVGLMVVNLETNRPCSWTESGTRTFTAFMLSLIPGIGPLIEPVVAVVARDGRRLGDRLAGTQVIEVRDYEPEE